ncbi:hypothetical protein P153DRAFT_63093 [Dothidotthia symphoricarpi CBS 119687]|uniref:Uncharacterized protein n=1 Tax=Dothidotthia symphoricarpi CBS 119687 TaxID=1392245 RepID=A0A6A6A867_9PLEO|nr:uncharacterized protein P153DRAFT_63093 [Dothidotthia symphoricarpi CBS 119687]KAF2127274.1 hypothetical protein P153DRAFT_63093 [Dothidotthia symphoricarpi CBS 119687]
MWAPASAHFSLLDWSPLLHRVGWLLSMGALHVSSFSTILHRYRHGHRQAGDWVVCFVITTRTCRLVFSLLSIICVPTNILHSMGTHVYAYDDRFS